VWSGLRPRNDRSIRPRPWAGVDLSLQPTLDVVRVVSSLASTSKSCRGGIYWGRLPRCRTATVLSPIRIALGDKNQRQYEMVLLRRRRYGAVSWTRQSWRCRRPHRHQRYPPVIGGIEWETSPCSRGKPKQATYFNRDIVMPTRPPPDFKPSDTFMSVAIEFEVCGTDGGSPHEESPMAMLCRAHAPWIILRLFRPLARPISLSGDYRARKGLWAANYSHSQFRTQRR